jgi:hypothetical protein
VQLQCKDSGAAGATTTAAAMATMSSTGAGAQGVQKAAVKQVGRTAIAQRPAKSRVTAASRTRRHMVGGKRHVEKIGEDAFQRPARSSSAKAANTMGYVITKVALQSTSYTLRPAACVLYTWTCRFQGPTTSSGQGNPRQS